MDPNTDKILMMAVFQSGKVLLVEGDPQTHAERIPHLTVEITDKFGEVLHAWLYEFTHPMNEFEAYWKWGQEVQKMAQQDKAIAITAGLPGASANYASLFFNMVR